MESRELPFGLYVAIVVVAYTCGIVYLVYVICRELIISLDEYIISKTTFTRTKTPTSTRIL